MTKIFCDVESCLHNKDGECCATYIKLGKLGICATGEVRLKVEIKRSDENHEQMARHRKINQGP